MNRCRINHPKGVYNVNRKTNILLLGNIMPRAEQEPLIFDQEAKFNNAHIGPGGRKFNNAHIGYARMFLVRMTNHIHICVLIDHSLFTNVGNQSSIIPIQA